MFPSQPNSSLGDTGGKGQGGRQSSLSFASLAAVRKSSGDQKTYGSKLRLSGTAIRSKGPLPPRNKDNCTPPPITGLSERINQVSSFRRPSNDVLTYKGSKKLDVPVSRRHLGLSSPAPNRFQSSVKFLSQPRASLPKLKHGGPLKIEIYRDPDPEETKDVEMEQEGDDRMSANLEQPPISVKATEKEEKNKERSKETPSIKEYSSELGDDYDSGDYHASWFEVRKSHSPLLLEHRGNGVPANIEESVTETDGPTEIEDPGKYMTHSDEIGATTRSVHVGSTLNPPSGLENSIDSQDEDHISGAIRKQNDSLLKQSSLSNEAPSTDSIHDQSASASARDKTEHESASPFTSEDELDGLFSSKNPADFAHLGCPGVSPTITARWRDPWAVPVGNVVYTIGQRLSRESGLLGNVEEHSQSQSSDSHDEMDHLMFGDDALEP